MIKSKYIKTNEDKWKEKLPNFKFCGYKTESYLQVKYSYERYSDQFWINGSIIPSESLINSILSLNINQSLFVLISACGYAQSRGAYGLEESELISKAIKTIRKTSESSKPAEAKEDKE